MWLRSRVSTPALIEKLSARLASDGKLPAQCNLSEIGPLKMAALFDELDPEAIIRDSVSCGMDVDEDLAILKALVERVERLAFLEGARRGDYACATARSDGFAAFPLSHKAAVSMAREKALCEAVERYVWAKWWDDVRIGADVRDAGSLSREVESLMGAIAELIPLRRRLLVQPKIKFSNHVVSIFFFEMESGGLLSGGACEPVEREELSHLRALGELARHAVCARKILNGTVPQTFYEKRLAYMVSGSDAVSALNQRLQQSGSAAVDLPALAIDQRIHHSLEDVVTVHRCYFEHQPPFVGGELERLCL